MAPQRDLETGFVSYLAALRSEAGSGLATEHTFRPALKSLLEDVCGLRATNEPKRAACGAPDYVVWRAAGGEPQTVGHVEAKDLGIPLDTVEASDQLRRYLDALPSLILTNYLEFRWYTDGEPRRIGRLARLNASGQINEIPGGRAEVEALLSDFASQSPVALTQPAELARRMARLTRLMREIIVESFKKDAATELSRNLRAAFSDVLVPQLSVGDFADMFAQTIAYGLFAARANHNGPEPFRRRDAAYEIPRTNPFLRKLFGAITGPDLDDEPFAGIVDDLAQLLAATDMDALLANFGRQFGRGDPVVHFYETFLAAYDPVVREMRGVYYTPAPVVAYMVESIDQILRTEFGCAAGLAELAPEPKALVPVEAPPRVLVLDPACGTGTFLYAIVERIREEFRALGNAGKWSAYVREQLLPRLFGFELLVAPYAVAHLKLGMQLAAQDLAETERIDWAYDLKGGERLSVYLTNTLEEAMKKSELLLGSYIAEEANAAASVKRELPILVVVGNPPYSGHSANTGAWIRELVGEYGRARPGIPRPDQGKWLQDDYVKFIRFGQWRIDQTGSGVLAFITNHSWIDGPTFAGMRHSLSETFSDIYVLDLHGNANKRERSPDGSVDQNVFDIRQGVAISIFVKLPDHTGPARVHHADLHGRRQLKYGWLADNGLASTSWTAVTPRAPQFLFVPEDGPLADEYERGWSIAEIMSEGGKPAMGVVTTHDNFAISSSLAEAEAKVTGLLATSSEEQARGIWKLCSQDQWSYERAKTELSTNEWRPEVRQILYRPFDVRWTVFNRNVAVHTRQRVTHHMHAGPNLGLITSKQTKGEQFAHALATRLPVEAICLSSKTGNNAFLFPLYLYPDEPGRQRRLMLEDEPTGRRPNLNAGFIAEICAATELRFVRDGGGDLETCFGPEDVFHYLYAYLHDPVYRSRYAAQLTRGFARVTPPSSRDEFVLLTKFGSRLVGAHLVEGPTAPSGTRFPVPGTNVVAPGHPRYLAAGEEDPETGNPLQLGRIYLSSPDRHRATRGQYFEGVPPEVWEFDFGGHRVCAKWLKDRRGQSLTLADLEHFERIVGVVKETIELARNVAHARHGALKPDPVGMPPTIDHGGH